jgi:hypothetical protein
MLDTGTRRRYIDERSVSAVRFACGGRRERPRK